MYKNTCENSNRVANVFGDVESVFNHFFDKSVQPASEFRPRWDIAEGENVFQVTLELPGVSPDDVHVEVEDGVLSVYGEKKIDRAEDKIRFHQSERTSGTFKRTLEFTTPVELDNVQAEFDQGLLVISVPKSEKVLPRKIEIKANNG